MNPGLLATHAEVNDTACHVRRDFTLGLQLDTDLFKRIRVGPQVLRYVLVTDGLAFRALQVLQHLILFWICQNSATLSAAPLPACLPRTDADVW